MKVKSLSHVRLFASPWTAAYQAPLSMGFSRQEYWSGLHCLLQKAHISEYILEPFLAKIRNRYLGFDRIGRDGIELHLQLPMSLYFISLFSGFPSSCHLLIHANFTT